MNVKTSPQWRFILIVQTSRGGRPLIEKELGVYCIKNVMRKKAEFAALYGDDRIIQEFVE